MLRMVLGNLEDACSVYEHAIVIERGKEHSPTLAMVFTQYSRFVYMVLGNAEKARDILAEGLEHVLLSKPLLEALIHLESIQSLPKRIDYVDSLVEKFVVSPGLDSASLASAAEREKLSCIFFGASLSPTKLCTTSCSDSCSPRSATCFGSSGILRELLLS